MSHTQTKLLKASTIQSVWRNPLHFIAFGFGSGVLPFMPGTYGTLAAIPIYLLLMHLSLWMYTTIVVLFTVASILICHRVEKDIGIPDYTPIVLDEFVGYLVTMIGAPLGIFWIITGFVLFRIFDILKPWPIDWIDKKVKGGFGMILDDVIAGIFAWVILQSIAYLWFLYN